jgi:crossover junction endodeoxyribonuclease RusA
MSKTVTLTFPIPNGAILNANMPINYRVKAMRVKALRDLSFSLGTEMNIPEFKECTVKIIVYPPSSRRVDPPNFYPTVKPLIDGLTDAGAWADDDWKHLREMTFLHGGDKSNISQVYILKLVINGEVVTDE